MALSARSVSHRSEGEVVSWHTPAAAEVPASELWSGQRRLEAEAYLHPGYQVRKALEKKASGWTTFSAQAVASTPPRIKQVLVSREHGVPYLNTSQVFDPWPSPRKWLAMSKTHAGAERLVQRGTILVMASATVGRSILATSGHENAVISHHFMRVSPTNLKHAGWIYAYLRSPQARAMMDATQYASVIRHIEPHHLHRLPIPVVTDQIASHFEDLCAKILDNRDRAIMCRRQAEDLYSQEIGLPTSEESEIGFTRSSRDLSAGRRRFEADYHVPAVNSILNCFGHTDELGSICEGIWWGKRFKRNYGESGIDYLSADDLFTTNRYYSQKILVRPADGHESFFVKSGWLLMACSGQTYGLNGAVTIATSANEGVFFSHDLIRIVPKADIRPGYLMIALTHPALGRPLLMREAYGMSIPHLDPEDVSRFRVARLGSKKEAAVADLAEASIKHLESAESIERQISDDAYSVIQKFVDN